MHTNGFDLITWAARNRHLVKPVTLHCPIANAQFHERVKERRSQLRSGFVGVDQALDRTGRRQDRKYKYD